MESVFLNGGMIGATLDFTSVERYVVGQNQQYLRPILVGSQTYNRAGSTSATNVTFALTGGINSTPQAGDIVILAMALGANLTTFPSTPSGYTIITQVSANDTYDSVLNVSYKVMGSTPDTTFPVPSALSTSNSQMMIVYVWRGADASTPLDVTTQTSSGINGRLAVPPPITPVTENAIIMSIGATAYSGTVYAFSAGGNLTGFVSTSGSDTYDGALGVGYNEWVSGTFTPTAFSITGSTTNDSWTGVSLALKPALTTVPVYGNYKNSGIWSLQSAIEAANKNIPNNVPGLQLWMDANDSATLTFSSGNSISSWKDKKNGVVYTTGSASIPTLTTVNGLIKPAVAFPSATVSYLKTATPTTISTPQTIFFVASWYTVSGYKSIGILSADTTTALQSATGVPYAVLFTSTGLNGLPQIATSSTAYSYAASNGVVEGDASIVEMIFNTNTTTSSFAIDGVTVTPTSASGASPSTLGYRVIGTSDTRYTAGGAFGEILVYEGILTAEQRFTIRKYLQAKWGTNPL
jgi:hypothetical protein